MDISSYDSIVVGAGQAGLATSFFLKNLNIKHLVLERNSIGESWRSQRWDSFTVNTPNTLNVLPHSDPVGKYPDGFCTRDELVESFEKYAKKFGLPVILDSQVTCVGKSKDPDVFLVRTRNGPTEVEFRTRSVVVASGMMQSPRIPKFSKNISNWVHQIHASNYRSPSKVPAGAIVVVGSGQSGCQIVEDLQGAGRRVYLCTSRVGRIPRRYRGREIDYWWKDSGFLDVTVDEINDNSVFSATQPQVSGVGRYGHTISLQKLAKAGVTLLGRLKNIERDNLILEDNLPEHIRFADQKSKEVKENIDEYILRSGIETTKSEDDPADIPWPEENYPTSPTILNLKEAGVKTIIWCTGFTSDFSWIDLPVLDESGLPVHSRGVTSIPGFYFVGFPWLHKRKSGLICGVAEDSEYISKQILDMKGKG